MRRTIAIWTCAIVLASVAPAGAQPHGGDAEALQLTRQSLERYREGRFREAVELLKRAYDLKPEPVIQYNIGRAYERLGERDNAIAAYRAYLAAAPNAPDRSAVEAKIAALVQENAKREATPPEVQITAPVVQRAETPRALSRTPWLIAGLGVAGVGTGAVFGALMISRRDDANDPSTSGRDTLVANAAARRYSIAANIAFVTGSVIAAGGITWGIVDWVGSRRSKSRVLVDAQISPNGLALRVRY